jgi:hypothetical protein
MKLRILDEATDEFAAAIDRYESIESGLGVRLKQEVRAAISLIQNSKFKISPLSPSVSSCSKNLKTKSFHRSKQRNRRSSARFPLFSTPK